MDPALEGDLWFVRIPCKRALTFDHPIRHRFVCVLFPSSLKAVFPFPVGFFSRVSNVALGIELGFGPMDPAVRFSCDYPGTSLPMIVSTDRGRFFVLWMAGTLNRLPPQ